MRPALLIATLLLGCPPAASAPGDGGVAISPRAPASDEGLAVSSVIAFGAVDGAVEIFAKAPGRILRVAVKQLPREPRWFPVSDLEVALFVGEDLSGVMPSGPAIPRAPSLKQLAPTAGEVFVGRAGSGKVEVSARGLRFASEPTLQLAPQTLEVYAYPP